MLKSLNYIEQIADYSIEREKERKDSFEDISKRL